MPVLPLQIEDLVVNWHVTEACNFHCGYCFAHWERASSKRELWKDRAQTSQLLTSLYRYFDPVSSPSFLKKHLRWQNLRLSLAGGEPTLLSGRFTEIAAEAKSLGFKVSLITNGSRPDVIIATAKYLDVIGISIDSANHDTNLQIGRGQRPHDSMSIAKTIDTVARIRAMQPTIVVKVNTVVSAANAGEDLSSLITWLRPDRWKIMRVLPVLSNTLVVEPKEFAAFIDRHRQFRPFMTIEDNSDMETSYIMVDPHGRFFQNGQAQNEYAYSRPILEVGSAAAFAEIGFRANGFAARYSGEPCP